MTEHVIEKLAEFPAVIEPGQKRLGRWGLLGADVATVRVAAHPWGAVPTDLQRGWAGTQRGARRAERRVELGRSQGASGPPIFSWGFWVI